MREIDINSVVWACGQFEEDQEEELIFPEEEEESEETDND